MAFYYTITLTQITATTSLTDQLRSLTIANQSTTKITSCFAAANNGNVGGIIVRLNRYSTASTVGTSVNGVARNTRYPSAQTTFFTGPTVGTTATTQQIFGVQQAGGTGGWFTNDPDDYIVLQPNGGANGNLDLLTLSTTATQTMDATLVFHEH